MIRTTAFFYLLFLCLGAAVPKARGQGVPEIQVRHTDVSSFSGTVIPDSGTLNWGNRTTGAAHTETFMIDNVGTALLTGLMATVDGPNADEFKLTFPTATTQPPGGRGFSIAFQTNVVGVQRSAVLHIASNDADENPYDIVLTATGVSPEIRVEGPGGQEIVNGGTYDFGNVAVGTWSHTSMLIRNIAPQGQGPLYVWPITKSGEHQNHFSVTSNFLILDNGGSNPWQLGFSSLTPGLRTAKAIIKNNDLDENPFEITLTGTAVYPKIEVEGPEGTPVAHQETLSFGEVGLGVKKEMIFTFRNPGIVPLTLDVGLAPGIDITLPLRFSGQVLPGGSTTVTVQFKPKYERYSVDTATLVATHNAGGSGLPFRLEFPITGEGRVSKVSFASALVNVSHGDTEAQVTLTRTNPGIPAMVQVQTIPLAASGVPPLAMAEPDVDYTPLSGAATTVSFATGEAQKTVAVPLRVPAAKAGVNRHFKVVLNTPAPGTELGTLHEAMVRIRAIDTTKPTLTLTTPVVTAGRTHATSPMPVTGIVGDAKGIERVEVKLNDAAPVVATLDANAKSPTAVPFTALVTPLPGDVVNVLVVTAYDLKGNSTSVTRSFTFTRRRLLTLMSRSDLADDPTAGTVAMTATPASGATALLAGVWHVPGDFWDPDGDDYQIKTTMVAPGTKIRVVTTPKAGKVFGRWWVWAPLLFDEEIPAQHLGNEVTFTMPDTDVMVDGGVTSVTFAPKEGETNSIHWLAEAFSATEPSAYLRGTVTSSGSFSGKLLIAGEAVPVVATLSSQAPAVFSVAGKKRTSLTIKNWEVILAPRTDGDMPSLDVGLPGERFFGLAFAMRGSYSARNKVPRSLLNVGGVRGHYTASLQVPMSGIRAPAAGIAHAKGTGYLTMNLTNTGALTLAGMMADGETMTMSSELLNTSAPVFVQMPTPGGSTKGALLCGMMEFKGTETEPYVNDYLRWYRPAAASTKVLLYPKGWPDGITVELHGEPYSGAVTVQASLLGASAPEPGQDWGNGWLYFTGGGLTQSVSKDNFNVFRNSVVKMAPVDSSYTLTLSPTTGLFSGTFTPIVTPPKAAAGPKLNFKGVILQSYSKIGLGFFINNAKGVVDQESGSVSLF